MENCCKVFLLEKSIVLKVDRFDATLELFTISVIYLNTSSRWSPARYLDNCLTEVHYSVTGFVKGGLPHISDYMNLEDHNLVSMMQVLAAT